MSEFKTAQDLQALYDRMQEANEYKDRWLSLYIDLYRYVIPDRDALNERFNFEDRGKPTTQQIWDSTAMLAAYQRANDIHGLLLPYGRDWGSLTLNPTVFSEQQIEADAPIFEKINDRVRKYLRQSNLTSAVAEANLDLTGGTAALWVYSPSQLQPLEFQSIPAISLIIEYVSTPRIRTVWYKKKMLARHIINEFPTYNGLLLRAMKENLNDTHMVYYGQIEQQNGKYFIYATVEGDPQHVLWEQERNYPQIIVYRDKVRPGEVEGRGIGIDMLPSIRDLNHIVRDSRKNLAFKAMPPIFYNTGSYFNANNFQNFAGAFIAKRPGEEHPLQAMETPSAPEVIEHIRDLQIAIKEGFKVDPLGSLEQPVRTATEVSIRENRAQRNESIDISRLINELPRQIYEVATAILMERDLLFTADNPQPANFEQQYLDFEFESPLFDLQRKDNVARMSEMLQLIQQFGGENAVLATANLPDVIEWFRDNLNLPQDTFPPAKLKQFAQNLAKMMQQQQVGQAPQPSTAASQVSIPTQEGVQI